MPQYVTINGKQRLFVPGEPSVGNTRIGPQYGGAQQDSWTTPNLYYTYGTRPTDNPYDTDQMNQQVVNRDLWNNLERTTVDGVSGYLAPEGATIRTTDDNFQNAQDGGGWVKQAMDNGIGLLATPFMGGGIGAGMDAASSGNILNDAVALGRNAVQGYANTAANIRDGVGNFLSGDVPTGDASWGVGPRVNTASYPGATDLLAGGAEGIERTWGVPGIGATPPPSGLPDTSQNSFDTGAMAGAGGSGASVLNGPGPSAASWNAATGGGARPDGFGFNVPTVTAVGTAALGLSALLGGGGASGTTTVTNSQPPMSAEERSLIQLNSDLARRQLGSIDQLAPFQRELLDAAMADTRRIAANNAAYDAAFPAAQQAQMARAEADRVARLGPVQDELLQIQLQQLRQGGRATPEQLASIQAATDAGIASGTGDIDDSTQRGIGLIADELANSRGLRLSDSPISSEAALLSREGMIQKGALIRNMRAGQAQAALNYPLAVQQVQAAGAQGQQSMADAASQFQANLRQQAYNNRLALTGQAQQGGIGLAGIGAGSSALNALTTSRMAGGTSTTNTSRGIGLQDIGQLAQGLGSSYLAYNRMGLGF